MPIEKFIESILIRDDNRPEVDIPTFADIECDEIFEFEGTVKLVQIAKSVQNKYHNRHDYVFKIVEIKKLQKEDA